MKRQEILNPMVFKTPQPKTKIPDSPVKQNRGDNADEQITAQIYNAKSQKHLENISPLLYNAGIGKDQYVLYIKSLPQLDGTLTDDDRQIYTNQMIKWGSFGLKRLLEMHIEHTKELIVSNNLNPDYLGMSLKFYSSYTLCVANSSESQVESID